MGEEDGRSRDHHPDVKAPLDLPSLKQSSVLLAAPEEQRGSDRPSVYSNNLVWATTTNHVDENRSIC